MGDSITHGTFVWRRSKNAYPVQLQALLGERYCVRNFGVNAHAAQRGADFPYWKSEMFAASTAFAPDIVLIMLGTNDCRGSNWKGAEAFRADYQDLVAHYLTIEPRPEVWLLTPPALYRLAHSRRVRYRMDEGALAEICGEVKSGARELGCGLIDINAATAGNPEAFRFDGVHPGTAGARLIAEAVFGALSASEGGGSGAHPGTY